MIVGAESRNVQIARWAGERGEEVEVSLDGPRGALTWADHGGNLTPIAGASAADAELVERLVADSPDRFVLAQMRGASYTTIARNVRAADASDGHEVPLWEIVRIDDPASDPAGDAGSRWRLYYLNERTGLIDRIVSQLRGQTIEAQFLDWTNYSGELVPTRITWTQASHTFMEFRLTSFSHAQ